MITEKELCTNKRREDLYHFRTVESYNLPTVGHEFFNIMTDLFIKN